MLVPLHFTLKLEDLPSFTLEPNSMDSVLPKCRDNLLSTSQLPIFDNSSLSNDSILTQAEQNRLRTDVIHD